MEQKLFAIRDEDSVIKVVDTEDKAKRWLLKLNKTQDYWIEYLTLDTTSLETIEEVDLVYLLLLVKGKVIMWWPFVQWHDNLIVDVIKKTEFDDVKVFVFAKNPQEAIKKAEQLWLESNESQ